MDFKKYTPILAGLCFSLIFGFSFMFTKEGLEVINTFHLLGFRFGVAAISLTILKFLGIIEVNFRGKRLWLLFILAVVQPGLYFLFETLGINLTTSSEAGLMISLIPVVVTVLAAIFLKEKPGKIQLLFILLSVAGVIFIIFMKGNLNVEKNYLGMLFLGGAVFMGGIYNILSRYLSLNFKPLEITFFMMWMGAILFNIISITQHSSIFSYFSVLKNKQLIISVLYLGLLSSVVAFLMLNFTLSRIKAFESAVFSNLVTVISIIAGVFFRGEPFYWFQIIGGIMIITGVWGTNYYGKVEKQVKKLPV